MQTNLAKPKLNYSYGPYNKIGKTEQWIRITEGCPWGHVYCYEPKAIKIFDIPKSQKTGSSQSSFDMGILNLTFIFSGQSNQEHFFIYHLYAIDINLQKKL